MCDAVPLANSYRRDRFSWLGQLHFAQRLPNNTRYTNVVCVGEYPRLCYISDVQAKQE